MKKFRVASCSSFDCEIDLYELRPTPPGTTLVFVDSLEKVLGKVNDGVWPAKVDRFIKWLKDYKVVADLGYIVEYKDGKIERIVNIHVADSRWYGRPVLRVVDIAEFGPEPEFEDEDD